MKEPAMPLPLNSSRRRRFALALPALALPLCSARAMGWIAPPRIKGNGVLRRQTRPLSGVRAVGLSLGGDLEVRLGEREQLLIETDENLLPHIASHVKSGHLAIRQAERATDLQPTRLKMVVTVRSLERLALGGSGTITAQPLRAGRFQIDLGGSGAIQLLGLEAERLHVTLGGSGDIAVQGGQVGTVVVATGGSGDTRLDKLACESADITLGGSGEVRVSARATLTVNLTGSGDVGYFGDPHLTRIGAGSGGVRRLGAWPAGLA